MKVVKFVQEGCNPCVALTNMLESMGKEVEAITIGGGNHVEIRKQYKVMSTPTMIAFDDEGKEVSRVSGANFGQISEFFEELGL